MFTIYNQRLAGYLMLNGYKLMGIAKNNKISKYNVFKFENTPALQDEIENYKKSENYVVSVNKNEETDGEVSVTVV